MDVDGTYERWREYYGQVLDGMLEVTKTETSPSGDKTVVLLAFSILQKLGGTRRSGVFTEVLSYAMLAVGCPDKLWIVLHGMGLIWDRQYTIEKLDENPHTEEVEKAKAIPQTKVIA